MQSKFRFFFHGCRNLTTGKCMQQFYWFYILLKTSWAQTRSILAWRLIQSSKSRDLTALSVYRYIFLLHSLTFYWASLRLKNFIETGNFYHGAARCSGRKFWSESFARRFEHFCAYLRLPWADHSDLGIIKNIFSSCRCWVSKMPILVESDDVRSGRKAKAR